MSSGCYLSSLPSTCWFSEKRGKGCNNPVVLNQEVGGYKSWDDVPTASGEATWESIWGHHDNRVDTIPALWASMGGRR